MMEDDKVGEVLSTCVGLALASVQESYEAWGLLLATTDFETEEILQGMAVLLEIVTALLISETDTRGSVEDWLKRYALQLAKGGVR